MKTKINISGIQEMLNIIGNKDFFEIYGLIKERNADFFNKGFSGIYNTKEEIKNSFEERIVDFLEEEYRSIRNSITSLRKKGKEVTFIDLKSLSIPLKIKMLKVNFNAKEFNLLLSLINFIYSNLKKVDEK